VCNESNDKINVWNDNIVILILLMIIIIILIIMKVM